jgi:DNA-binding MarR family transcriptional regulator
MPLSDDLLSEAMRSYGRALAVADPIRLRFWDGRGLTMPQLRVMYLARENGSATVGAIAAQMRVTAPTISGLTDRLVRQGLIERREDPDDRRLVRICLTDEGRAVLEEIDVAARAHMREVLSRLSETQVRDLVRALDGFVAAAETVHWSEAPA